MTNFKLSHGAIKFASPRRNRGFVHASMIAAYLKFLLTISFHASIEQSSVRDSDDIIAAKSLIRRGFCNEE